MQVQRPLPMRAPTCETPVDAVLWCAAVERRVARRERGPYQARAGKREPSLGEGGVEARHICPVPRTYSLSKPCQLSRRLVGEVEPVVAHCVDNEKRQPPRAVDGLNNARPQARVGCDRPAGDILTERGEAKIRSRRTTPTSAGRRKVSTGTGVMMK